MRILEDFLGILGNLTYSSFMRDSSGFLGILWDSLGFYGIFGNLHEIFFSHEGFLMILDDS